LQHAAKNNNRKEATMKVKVEMWAFQEGKIRIVEIPRNPHQTDLVIPILSEIFKYGQNEFQPNPERCSVSVGDVINLFNKRWLVMPKGFRELKKGQRPPPMEELYGLRPVRN
jgi:hypothetical protein